MRDPLYRVLDLFSKKNHHRQKISLFYVNCDQEKDNEYHKHVVAIIYDSFHSNEVVGHVPLYWRELANKYLKFSNYHICVVVTGKRVNRGISLGLEIPVHYFFHGDK